MAATLTTNNLALGGSGETAVFGRTTVRRRQISREAGRALEVLGHAIDYLTDEYVHAGGSICPQDAQVEAVQLLMKVNREIYLGCPAVPTMEERLRSLLHFGAA